MMDYGVFKHVIVERLKEDLPPVFSKYQIRTLSVPKVNGPKDAITLEPPDSPVGVAVPTIYFDDMYHHFCDCEDLDEVVSQVINIFIEFTSAELPGIETFDFSNMLDRLVMNLINTDMNSDLLETVPHTDFLDLSVIYRFIVNEGETGFGTVLLNDDLMKGLKVSLEEIHELACENTLRLFPPKLSEALPHFCIMTNDRVLNGATLIACRSCLQTLAEKMGTDFYIIPGSIHEIYAVPVAEHELKDLLRMLKEGNARYTSGSELLSTSIYCYSINSGELEIAGTYSLN